MLPGGLSENRRNHHILIRLIKQNVAHGTTILTDKWKGYNALSRNGYNHLVINHRRGFVDPVTRVHTRAPARICGFTPKQGRSQDVSLMGVSVRAKRTLLRWDVCGRAKVVRYTCRR